MSSVEKKRGRILRGSAAKRTVSFDILLRVPSTDGTIHRRLCTVEFPAEFTPTVRTWRLGDGVVVVRSRTPPPEDGVAIVLRAPEKQ